MSWELIHLLVLYTTAAVCFLHFCLGGAEVKTESASQHERAVICLGLLAYALLTVWACAEIASIHAGESSGWRLFGDCVVLFYVLYLHLKRWVFARVRRNTRAWIERHGGPS